MIDIDSWSNYLNKYKNADNRIGVFNKYLDELPKKSYILIDSVCLCEKINSDYFISYVNKNKICTEEYNGRNKRKIFNILSNYDIIITKGFPIDQSSVNNKIILRHEIIINFLTSNNSHFFSPNLVFSVNDNTVFFTEEFKSIITKNIENLNVLKFSSFLLNTFELGFVIDDLKLKPIINVSPYGRWYWNNTEKIQTDKIARKKVYNKLLKYGRILNIDLVSGEPTILGQLAESKIMQQIIDFRIKAKNEDLDASNALKNMLNIFIHSLSDPETSYERYADKYDYKSIEKRLGINILSLLEALQNDLLWYNKGVISSYRKNLCVNELFRRLFIPETPLLDDKNLIKEHRKFLQGHTHDRILNLAKLNYDSTGLLPIFTIHDSISYYINHKDYNTLTELLTNNAKILKYPITIEIIEN